MLVPAPGRASLSDMTNTSGSKKLGHRPLPLELYDEKLDYPLSQLPITSHYLLSTRLSYPWIQMIARRHKHDGEFLILMAEVVFLLLLLLLLQSN